MLTHDQEQEKMKSLLTHPDSQMMDQENIRPYDEDLKEVEDSRRLYPNSEGPNLPVDEGGVESTNLPFTPEPHQEEITSAFVQVAKENNISIGRLRKAYSALMGGKSNAEIARISGIPMTLVDKWAPPYKGDK